MNLKQIDAFRAVMRTGSVTRAAQSLHVSQPAITRLIRDMEHAVGYRLFERAKGSGITPTVDAEALYTEVEKSFVGLNALRRAAEDIRHFKGGQLRIASLPALAMGFLPKVISAFTADYPDISIQLQTRSSATVRQWVANQQFDLGLARPAPEAPGVEMQLFSAARGVCVLPPGHPLAAKTAIEPEDLAGEPFISLAMEDKTRHQTDRLFEERGIARNVVVETQYAATICGLVLEGIGTSVVSPFTAADFKDRGLIIRPFTEEILFDYMLFLPATRPPSRLATAFIDTMKRQLAEVECAAK